MNDERPTLGQADEDFKDAFGRMPEPGRETVRGEDGKFIPGATQKLRMATHRGLSRNLRRYMRAKFGDERVYYQWLIEIANPANAERTVDRLKAIEAIALRVDGAPLAKLEVSGVDGKPVEVTGVSPELTTAQRLAAVAGVLGGTGALALASEAGTAGDGAHATLEQVPPADGGLSRRAVP